MVILSRWLAPTLMSIVALSQIFLTSQTPLSPWKGGGFGMFSGMDRTRMRFVTATAVDNEGRRILLDMEHALFQLYRKDKQTLLANPDTDNLQKIGERLLKSKFLPYSSFKHSPEIQKILALNRPSMPSLLDEQIDLPHYRIQTRSQNEMKGIELRQVTLNGWKITYDARNETFSTNMISGPVFIKSATDDHATHSPSTHVS